MAENTLSKNIIDTITYLGNMREALKNQGQDMDNVPVSEYSNKISAYTTDADAIASDIISPKTAYVNGEKITGTIVPTYEHSDNIISYDSNLYSGSLNIIDISDKLKLALCGTIGTTNSLYLYNLDENNVPNQQLLIIPNTIWASGYVMRSAGIGKTLNSQGNVNIYIITNAREGDNYRGYLYALQYDITTQTIVQNANWTYNPAGYRYSDASISINPNDDGLVSVCWQGRISGVDSQRGFHGFILRYNDETNTITSLYNTTGYGPAYQEAYDTEWDNDGVYCYIGGGKNTNSGGKIIKYLNDTSFVQSLNETTTMGNRTILSDGYWLRNNEIMDLQKTSLKTLNNISTSGYRWSYKGFVFIIDNTTLYIYYFDKIHLNFILKHTISLATTAGARHTLFKPISNSYAYMINGATLYQFKIDDSDLVLTKLKRSGREYSLLDTTIITSTEKVLEGNDYYNGSGLHTGTMTNNGALSYTPTTSQQTIPAGYTSGGTISAVTSSIDNNIVAENIKKDISILGVIGTYEGSGGGSETVLDVGNQNVSVSGTTLIFEGGN